MKAVLLIVVRIVALAVVAVGLFKLDQWITLTLYSVLDTFEDMSRLARVIGTVALVGAMSSAVVAGIATITAAVLFRRYILMAALVAVLPLLSDRWPWNSLYHDIAWSPWEWALSFYEFLILIVFVVLGAMVVRRYTERSNNGVQATREDARA